MIDQFTQCIYLDKELVLSTIQILFVFRSQIMPSFDIDVSKYELILICLNN